MAEKNFKSRVLNGLFWKLLEQTGYQGIQFVVALVLARLMSPEEYGTISLIMIFITIANTFIQSGFATALIQKKDIREEDYSSVFWLTMGMAVLCYGLLSLAAPWIAAYYETPVLTALVRVMGLVLFPGAVISIQTAFVSRTLKFQMLFKSTMLAVAASGGISIGMALVGLGVWAMAAQQLVYYFVLMLSLFFIVRWVPKREFSFREIRDLFSFGWKILVSGLIDTVWQNIYGLVIGKQYSSAELGVYNRGEQFPKLLTTNLTSAIQSVMLPAYAALQEDRDALKNAARRSVKLSGFLVFPMMAGMLAVARPLVLLLLTEKWIAAVPYLCLMCVGYAIYPIHTINLQLLNAQGRSDLFLKLEIVKKLLGIVLLLVSLPLGILPMMILKVADEYLCLVINAWPNRHLLHYGPSEQLVDLLPSALCSMAMGLGVAFLLRLALSPLPMLLLQMLTGVLLYLVLSWIFNREALYYIIRLAGNRRGSNC